MEKRFIARLRDKRNGRTVDHAWTWLDSYASPIYMWTDWNYGCDCNRSLFMYGEEGAIDCNKGDADQVIELVALIDESTGHNVLLGNA